MAFIILIVVIAIIAIISNKPMLIDHTPPEAESIIEALKKKYPDKEYKKLSIGEFLDEDTPFSKYSFINNNSIYIFNPSKLDDGKFEYKKVYDIDKSIKVMNIAPNDGADIKFYDYSGYIYTLHDDNINNKVAHISSIKSNPIVPYRSKPNMSVKTNSEKNCLLMKS